MIGEKSGKPFPIMPFQFAGAFFNGLQSVGFEIEIVGKVAVATITLEKDAVPREHISRAILFSLRKFGITRPVDQVDVMYVGGENERIPLFE